MKSEVVTFEDQNFYLNQSLQHIDENFFQILGKHTRPCAHSTAIKMCLLASLVKAVVRR